MKQTITKLKKKLDTIFSQYIRLRDSDINGYVQCISCGNTYHWKKAQNGHYVSRSVLALRFDEENCFAQCVSCNMFKNGNYINYRINLCDKVGEDKVKELESRRFDITKLTPDWYEEQIKYYTEQVNNFLKHKINDTN